MAYLVLLACALSLSFSARASTETFFLFVFACLSAYALLFGASRQAGRH